MSCIFEEGPPRVLFSAGITRVGTSGGCVTRTKELKRPLGGYVGGRPPDGFEAQVGELVTDERELEPVRLVIKLRNEGASYRVISASLADAGYKTQRGTSLNPAQVRSIVERSSEHVG
jgi:hypothetical protein